MKIVSIGERIMHFIHVEDEDGVQHEVPVDVTTFTVLRALLTQDQPRPKTLSDDDFMGHMLAQDRLVEGGNGKPVPRPLDEMPPDLAEKMASIGVDIPPSIDVRREEEQDPGEVFQAVEGDTEGAPSL